MAERVVQASFTGGILSEEMFGRIELERYSVGVKEAKNFRVRSYGGIENRAGSKFVNPVKDQSAVTHLYPFVFNVLQAYHLEFGDQYMRVIKDGGYVLDTSSAVTITGATAADPVVITTSGAHGFATGDHVYIADVVGMTEINGRVYRVTNLTSTTFSLQTRLDDSTDIDGSAFTAYASAGTATKIFEVATPWATADVPDIRFVQSNDVLTAVHPSYPVYDISRTDHDAWTVTLATFSPVTADPTALVLTLGTGAGSKTFKYKVTAVDAETGEESLAGVATAAAETISAATAANPVQITITGHALATGDEVEITGVAGMTELNDRRFTVDYVDANNVTLRDEDGSGHTAYSSGGSATPTFTQSKVALDPTAAAPHVVTWAAVTGAGSYNVYKSADNGFYGFIGSAENLSFSDTNIEPDVTDGPPKQRNPFDDTDEYPTAVTYFEERKVFGGTNNKPNTLEMTKTGHYKNLSNSRPLRDDDALTFTLAARQVNAIQSIVSIGGDLLPLTSGSIWAMRTGDQPLSASNPPKTGPHINYGVSNLPPLEIGKSVLIVERNLETIRDITYSFADDGYGSNDLTVLANHLFRDKAVVRWAYSQAPYSTAWAVMSDGTVNTLTYFPEHKVVAWTWQDFDGEVESVSIIPGSPEDEVAIVVKRTVDGNVCRFTEIVQSRRFSDIADAYFVDCGATLDVPLAISGATKADPVVVTTSSAHGLSDGDQVDISGVVGMTELNGGSYIVANKTSTTFELQDLDARDVDGTGYGTYSSGGYARKAVTTVPGLWWLEGRTVSVLANGSVEGEKVVTNGAITLSNPASRVHIGIGYNADLTTLPLGVVELQGRDQKITELQFRVHQSRGIYAGGSFDDLSPYVQDRDWSAPESPIPAESGIIAVTIDSGWDKEASVYIRQSDPLPLRILSMLPEVDAGS